MLHGQDAHLHHVDEVAGARPRADRLMKPSSNSILFLYSNIIKVVAKKKSHSSYESGEFQISSKLWQKKSFTLVMIVANREDKDVNRSQMEESLGAK